MQTVPCPGCAAPLEPDQEVCGKCRRPRDQGEIERGRESLQESERRRRARPRKAAGLLLAAAAAGALVRERGWFRAKAAALRGEFDRRMQSAAEPRPGPAPAAAPAEQVVPKPDAAPVPAPAPTPAPPAAPGPAPADDLPLPHLEPSQWALYGRVYDLLTLAPVPNAAVSVRMTGKSGDTWVFRTASDEFGRYVVKLERIAEGDYEVQNSKPGYAPVVLYEADVPYASMTEKERRSLAVSAREGEVAPGALADVRGEESLRRDLFLVPQR